MKGLKYLMGIIMMAIGGSDAISSNLRGVALIDRTQLVNEVLVRHNHYRTLHQAPPVRLASEIQIMAQTWADTLQREGKFQHGMLVDSKNRPVGQNLAWRNSTSMNHPFNISARVDSWYKEIVRYNFSDPKSSFTTGHFTQLVWNATTFIGVGISQGPNGTYVVVDYFPAGNVAGQYPQNVFPILHPNQ